MQLSELSELERNVSLIKKELCNKNSLEIIDNNVEKVSYLEKLDDTLSELLDYKKLQFLEYHANRIIENKLNKNEYQWIFEAKARLESEIIEKLKQEFFYE